MPSQIGYHCLCITFASTTQFTPFYLSKNLAWVENTVPHYMLWVSLKTLGWLINELNIND